MNTNRFDELMYRYLTNKATAEERKEFMRLIDEGDHDETLHGRIESMLADDSAVSDMDPRKSQMILKSILSQNVDHAPKVRKLSSRSSWYWVAAAAVLLITASVGWWVSIPNSGNQASIALLEEKQEYALFSGKQFLRLPDGSTVLLNEGSKLSYETSFGKQAREVTLVGEGYFDVQHDPSKRFVVLTGKITTTVLGTAFNVKAYPGDHEVKVSVTRGKVQVGDSLRTFGIITPDQEIAVNTITNDFIKTSAPADKAAAWQVQYLILDNISLDEASKVITEKYGVEITLANERLKACRITATFLHGEDLEQVLDVVCGVVQATYKKDPDGRVKIHGNGCD